MSPAARTRRTVSADPLALFVMYDKGREAVWLWFIIMGCCASSVPKEKIQHMPFQLCPKEVEVLILIYDDLSQRTVQRRLNLQNFLLFFHKNGFWGERLFKQFVSLKEEKDLSCSDFINGIAKIFKSTEKQKIQLLYKFFSKDDHGKTPGVYFHEFLTLLYNYPKEDLKEILNDRDFIDYELKKVLKKKVDVKMSETMLLSHEELFLRKSKMSWEEKKMDYESNSRREEEKEEHSMASIVGERIIQNAHEYRPHETMIGLINGDQVCDIKTINIQQIVKQFALKIFKDARVDHKSGTLTFDQFYNWISGHKALYQNYFQGFHFNVWEVDPSTKEPKFLSAKGEKRSFARLLIDDELMDVQMLLLHSILIICKMPFSGAALKVICLDGLAVTRICDVTHGLGVSITHKFQIYKEKKIFFKNEPLLLQWLELLKFYKGDSIHDKYIIGEKIGTGKFSVVYKCKHSFEQKEYAMKEIATFKLDPQALDLIAHESSIMQVIEHPLLLRFKECLQTRKHIYIITELVNGVKECEYLQQYDAAKIAQMIIVGVSYLHSLEIVHRDLKPQNIMVVKTVLMEIDFIKIIDMGFSNYLSQLNNKTAEEMLSGTPNYIAPQVLREEKIDFKIDNFAIGVIIYFMLTGALPFNGYDIPQILQNTMDGVYSYPESQPISDKAKHLIDSFLKNKPEERISLNEALKHPWFDILKTSKSIPKKRKPSVNPYRTYE